MENILILTDHYGYIFTSLRDDEDNSIRVSKLKEVMESKGYNVRIESLHSIPEDYKTEGTFVFYPSSESSGLFYKEYIEDVLLELQNKGMVLLPRFELFRAHHNKVFMEKLRDSLKNHELKTIHSYPLYCFDDLKDLLPTIEDKFGYPVVIKMSSGSGAKGVSIANDRKELENKVRKMASVKYRNYSTPWYSSETLSKTKRKIKEFFGKHSRILTYPQEKLVIQNYISNLNYDYKVLVFGSKYYILKRMTRDNDFRASGSGKFIFPDELTTEVRSVLTVAQKLFNELDIPMLSVDVAFDGKQCHIIEFQCVFFGPYTLQYSDMYFEATDDGDWVVVRKQSVLEEEIGYALDYYIRAKEW